MRSPDKKSSALPFKWIADARPIATEWRVKGMIPKKGIGLLIGWRGTGKTWIALTLSLMIACGRQFAERRTERCGVLYIAVDRPDQAIRRLQFLIGHYDLKDPPTIICRECPILTQNDNALDILLDTVSAVDTDIIKHKGFGVGVIIIDTLIMAAGWKDEQSSSEVNKVNRILRAVSEHTEAFVLLVDHTGKVRSRGARGSSEKEASTDIVLAIDDYTNHLVIDRITDGPQGLRIPFHLKTHEIGRDRDGDAITECTVEWGADPDTERDIVREGVLTSIDELNTASLMDIVKHCGWKPDMKDGVRRAVDKLVDAGLVRKTGDRSRGFGITENGKKAAGVVRDAARPKEDENAQRDEP